MISLLNKRGSVKRNAFVMLLAAFSLPAICVGQDVTGAIADSLRSPLKEGVTTFVVQLPKGADRFTFINENSAARGELKISVSNDNLAAGDPKWTSVDGTIFFNHKRLFNLSMVGVEANYVKLSFNVEKGDRIAALGQ